MWLDLGSNSHLRVDLRSNRERVLPADPRTPDPQETVDTAGAPNTGTLRFSPSAGVLLLPCP